jgi:hypothetical protein
MGQSLSDLQHMIDLAAYFRRCAADSKDGVWERKMLQAATDLEQRADAVCRDDDLLFDGDAMDEARPEQGH